MHSIESRQVRPSVQDEIGPRQPGAIYQNTDGRFEVLVLVTNRADAAQLLRRTAARWAVIVRDVLRPDAQPFAIGTVWADSDYLIRPAPQTDTYGTAA
ncbi:hypothetical protein [Streptomyces sp. AM6-12]|uniref:hypothetical protein n=1 Tax=Streptomyces sp. AM6-12 TaxID=3345149 RepID=UPI0037BA668D